MPLALPRRRAKAFLAALSARRDHRPSKPNVVSSNLTGRATHAAPRDAETGVRGVHPVRAVRRLRRVWNRAGYSLDTGPPPTRTAASRTASQARSRVHRGTQVRSPCLLLPSSTRTWERPRVLRHRVGHEADGDGGHARSHPVEEIKPSGIAPWVKRSPTYFPFLLGLLLLGCSDQTASTLSDASSPSRTDAGSGDGGREDDQSCAASKVQTLGAACCEDYGIDACGAGLFCAKLDGRTVATCYPNNIRKPGETCTAAVQCVTQGCSSGGLCVAARGDGCVPKDGCEKGYVCAAYLGDLDRPAKCAAIGDGDYCLTDKDCGSKNVCVSGHCAITKKKYAGESCTQSSECVDETAGCFQGACQCHKPNAWGCPLGKSCGGGNHAVYGHQCQ